ncbi:hypothetical protein TWF970_004520 [Orbilia oligospora]|uniref:Uncharacterized protein n=1 Tax=Orbilia oligospora TaxID=2813651 RepID=A0A7C8RDB9_ORBOL|nr:hypothetical protein TWF970_004520 [Orbilia oligospora]
MAEALAKCSGSGSSEKKGESVRKIVVLLACIPTETFRKRKRNGKPKVCDLFLSTFFWIAHSALNTSRRI